MLGCFFLAIVCGLEPEDEPMDAVVRGNSQFALDLYGQLAQEPGNLFFSPYSISSALAMTLGGAAGETAEQMADVLHLTLPSDELHPAFGALNTRLLETKDDTGYQLDVANRLWGQQGYGFVPGYLALTRDAYDAELQTVDFARATEEARDEINSWVEDQTKGKIQNLIPPGVLDSLTRLVLTNAIHFKGDWAAPFLDQATRDAPFFLPGEDEVMVPLMNRRGSYRYGEGEDLKILELPYGKGDLSMVVLLPDTRDGLGALEAKLNAEQLDHWIAGLRRQEVAVALPRFSLSSQFTLNQALSKLGMSLPFQPGQADFSGMDGSRELYITAAIHKAFVDVNEEGTEAAAATGIVVGVRSALPSEPKVFRADHPFLFLIRDTHTGSILFLGRLTNPEV
ncbi:serpin family protein [Tautonia marina]|uniref:serpin family protein n=1 Tax=Tautonia marina TaxID=2653855 RepID=UPI00126127C2|nr:serpin family protein [Tautonia marina]